MNGNQHHIIFKNKLEVKATNTDGFALKTRLSNLINNEALVQMNNLFDSLVNENEWLIIDKLDLWLGDIQSDKLELVFCEKLISELKEQILKKKHKIQASSDFKNATKELISNEKRILQLLIYFLENGNLSPLGIKPYNNLNENIFISAIDKETEYFMELFLIAAENYAFWNERLKSQFSHSFILHLTSVIGQMHDSALSYTTASSGLVNIKTDLISWLNSSKITGLSAEITQPYLENKYLKKIETSDSIKKENSAKEKITSEFYDKKLFWILINYLAGKISDSDFVRQICADEDKIIEVIIQQPLVFTSLLIRMIKENTGIEEKLENQFSEKFNKTLIRVVFRTLSDAKKKLKDRYTKIDKPGIHNLTGLITVLKSLDKNLLKFFEEIIASQELTYERKDISSDLKEKSIERIKEAESKATKEKRDDENEIYIDNAGLVLLHPFLENYFRQFKLLNHESKFANQESHVLAVHLLHFLATKEENPFEYSLTFEKYFCDYPLKMPIDRFVQLTNEMKDESENLLKAVIEHWKILKNTSPDGLREAFLQRIGKLILNENDNRIIIEQNSIDVLLEHLPWNCSIIKLPWMKQLLAVEWLKN